MTADAVTWLRDDLTRAPMPDDVAAAEVADRAANVLRPAGALARLDALAIWLAGWQRTVRPRAQSVSCVVFVAEHGVVAEGVSAYPGEVTAAMKQALRAGVATAAAYARELGTALDVVDVGVGDPTANLRTSDAMDGDGFGAAVDAGRRAVARVDDEDALDLVIVGEMGIGNTTAAAAVAAGLAASRGDTAPVAEWVGRGTGVDDATHAAKVAVVADAIARLDGADGLDVLRRVGGKELAAMAGAIAEARMRSIPVLLDGYVCTAAAAALAAEQSGALDHCRAGHVSAEPGHRRLLEHLALQPLLDLDLRLGEGQGALAALPLVRLGVAGVTDVATFEEFGLA